MIGVTSIEIRQSIDEIPTITMELQTDDFDLLKLIAIQDIKRFGYFLEQAIILSRLEGN